MTDLHEKLKANAPKRNRPLWAVWYGCCWASLNWRVWEPGCTDERISEARRIGTEICRSYGISPYARRRLSAADVDAMIGGETVAQPDEAPTVESEQDGDTWTLTGHRIKTLPELLDAADVDTDQWCVQTWRANSYEAQRKGGGIVQLWQVKASLALRSEWLWKPVTPQRVFPTPTPRETKTTLVIPDSQNGYRWDRDRRTLDPLHDRRAWDIVCKVAHDRQPDQIVMLGDMVDFAEGSRRWPVSRDLMDTTQATVAELHWWIARLREACPDARIVYIEGNHEDRIDRLLQQAAPELQSLRPVGEAEDWISWRRYLALDSLGVEYGGPYSKDAAIVIAPDCEATHGRVVRSGGGKTVAKIVAGAHVSTVVGHIHRLELAYRTLWSPSGHRTIFALSPGCLCRIDGAVPGVSARNDWQQGFAWLTHCDGTTHAQAVRIDDGLAVFDGRTWLGETRATEIAEATGMTWLQ